MYIDTHSHVYSDQFAADTAAMLDRALIAGVGKILMPAIDAATHHKMLSLEKENPQTCISMMGLHPCSVNQDYEKELAIVEGHLKSRRFVAIGETGLDFYWDLSFKDEQVLAFEQQIQWCLEYDLPVVIHSRESADACISIIKKYTPSGLRGVFHCFGGTVTQARQIIDEGFYLGIGGVLTFKKSGLDAVLSQLDMEQIILETDAPYLAPVPYRGKRNEPSYIPLIAQKLADVKQVSINDIASVTTANAKKLFRL